MSTDIDVAAADTLKKLKLLQDVCEPCVVGKQHRAINRVPRSRATVIGELIHTDIAGGGKIILIFNQRVRYVAVMTDDFIDYTTIYLLQRKFGLKIVLRKYLKQMKIRGTSV